MDQSKEDKREAAVRDYARPMLTHRILPSQTLDLVLALTPELSMGHRHVILFSDHQDRLLVYGSRVGLSELPDLLEEISVEGRNPESHKTGYPAMSVV